MADGRALLLPELEINTFWTSLKPRRVTAQQVVELYYDHGTSERFHSEFKTDLDIELPGRRAPRSGSHAADRLTIRPWRRLASLYLQQEVYCAEVDSGDLVCRCSTGQRATDPSHRASSVLSSPCIASREVNPAIK